MQFITIQYNLVQSSTSLFWSNPIQFSLVQSSSFQFPQIYFIPVKSILIQPNTIYVSPIQWKSNLVLLTPIQSTWIQSNPAWSNPINLNPSQNCLINISVIPIPLQYLRYISALYYEQFSMQGFSKYPNILNFASNRIWN